MFHNVCRWLAVVSVLALLALPSAAQIVATDAYQVHSYHAAVLNGRCLTILGAAQGVDIINTGQIGSPIDEPTLAGSVCADIYVFDNRQEMQECCSLRLTANELASVELCDLVGNALTGTTPLTGVIKIVSDLPRGGSCDPTSIQSPVNGAFRAWRTTLDTNLTPSSESAFRNAPLTVQEQQFLGQACAFVLYLGSGRGDCNPTH